jgi:protein SCO1/2
MLKMFLIDGRGEVREIYTLAFIQPDMMFNDIKTLAIESRMARRQRRRGFTSQFPASST